ncbi:MAG TPA: efflux RND transporter permease subunit, partial [Thermoanaerobaculia bacterium]|nr:efflux RND transporter permease subunit [Thermoanaerobaculia bacterium]
EDAINGVPGVAAIRSQSIQGLSVITAIFAGGTDLYRARQTIAERLNDVARRLPQTSRAPVMTPLTSSTGKVLVLGLTSPTRSLRDLRTFADWSLKPRLLSVPGVARVSVFGGEVRQLQVQIDPIRLRAHGLTIADVVAAARVATGVRGAGVIDNRNERLLVHTEGQLSTPALLAQSVVSARGGSVLRLGDVADVVEGSEPPVGAASVEGVTGIVVSIDAQLGANILEVTAAVEAALRELQPAIRVEGMVLHPALFRPANFVDVALANITHSLLIGAVLVAAVLLAFLADWGAAAVSLTAIPLSLLAAIVVLDHFGLSLNTLTIGGLAVAIGELADDAVIDVENILRRLRLNRQLAQPRPAWQVVIDASLEVRSSVVYATFIVTLVFLPVLAMSGVQGAIFRPLALAYILAILASLAVALTVTPAMTLALLARRRRQVSEPAWLTRAKAWYAARIRALEARPHLVVTITGTMIATALLMIPFFGGAFLPEFREGHYLIHMSAVPGTSLDESLRLGQLATQALRRDARVRSVAQRVGRAELADDSWGTHYSELEVDLVPLTGADAETVAGDIRRHLAQIPGVNFAVKPFLTERIEETLTGSTAQVVVKLVGNDLDSLDVAARRVASVASGITGATEVQLGSPDVTPEATVRLRPERLSLEGVAADEALAAIETAAGGTPVAQVFEGNRSLDVVVRMNPRVMQRAEDLAEIPLAGRGGRIVRLAEVADIARTSGRYVVAHEGAQRLQTVTMNVGGRDVASFASALNEGVRRAALPRGVLAEVGGTATAQRTAQRELLLRGLFAAAGILMLLAVAFGRARSVLLVLANLPFALTGGVFALFATGGLLSLGSLVGFVTLFGISTRNAIMLIAHYDHLVRFERAEWGLETAVRGATERFAPVLMTAAITWIGLVPLALGSGDPGREIEGPLAIVILGGLITSTALTLFVLPTLALRYGRFGAEAHE